VTDSADAARSPAGDLLPAITRAYGLTTPPHAQRLTGGYANEADIDWLVWDVASSLWPFCSMAGGELYTTAMEDFLDSYRAAGGRLPTAEDDLIIPLLRAKRILEVLRAPSDRNPCWDYQLTNLQAYQALS
jgi:hypothetical protein